MHTKIREFLPKIGWLALISIFGLCFMPVCIIKSNSYSSMYSPLVCLHQYLNPFPVKGEFSLGVICKEVVLTVLHCVDQ